MQNNKLVFLNLWGRLKSPLQKIILIFFFTSLSWSAIAAIDTYQFKDADKQQRFQQLTNELRCPKCQNQNLADSNAEIASDLRAKIHLMLEDNKSDKEIVDYMLERYGEFILYQPRLSKQTFLLWTAPALLLLIGVLVIALIIWFRKKAARQQAAHPALTVEQQQKLAAILKTEQENQL
jgi:cytochrome c-type biogenesis protein CcmH